MSTKLERFDLEVASLGDANCRSPDSRLPTFVDDKGELYGAIRGRAGSNDRRPPLLRATQGTR